ncbi:MAG: ABC transporter substrate-binding protein [Propionibacteriaceae bacterium]
MSFTRTRRTAVAAVSMSALLLAAACGSGGSEGEPGGETSSNIDMSEKGPITFVQGKDTSGNVQNELDAWNKEHPDEKVTLVELPDNADQQRAQMIQNAQTKGSDYTILNVDVVWTAEFAANGWIDELPEGTFDLEGFLQPTIDSATYFDKLYAVPVTSDGGMLYYRTDLLKEVGAEPPETWDEMKEICGKVQEKHAEIDCYAGQYQKYEGLTVNFAEAVNSSGGVIVGEDGKPAVDTPEAKAGLDFLVDSFADGTIPKGAITWQEEQGRVAFQEGNLVFHRNWPYIYTLAEKDDGSSKVNGKFAVAPLPGLDGPGVSSLGGHNYAISTFAKNKGTAIEFMKFMSSEEQMITRTKATSNAPTRESLYTDEELTSEFPYLPVLLDSIESAKPRPKAVEYGDVTLAIQDAVYGALQGSTPSDEALSNLQTSLEGLIK